MPRQARFKTRYPGVFYIKGDAVGRRGSERIYYIRYRKAGKSFEEKAGRQYQDDMTPARAAGIRARRIEGKEASNTERRKEKATSAAEWTIGRLWTEYRKTLKNPGRSDDSRWRLYLEKPFSKKKPKDLVKLDTDRVRSRLLKKRAPQTVKHVMGLLRRIINYGVGQGWIAPLSFKITMPHVDNIKTEDLTRDQLQRLFKVLETTHLTVAANMMKIALYTGMRRGEIFKLRWDDLDFQRGFILIREPKGGKSQKIPLNNSVRAVFERLPRGKNEYLFPARGGGPRRDAIKDFNRIKTAARLPADFRPMHGLRHLYATMLASSGKVDMYTLQKLLTHKSAGMTERYSHFRDEALRRAADQVDDIMADVMQADKVVAIK